MHTCLFLLDDVDRLWYHICQQRRTLGLYQKSEVATQCGVCVYVCVCMCVCVECVRVYVLYICVCCVCVRACIRAWCVRYMCVYVRCQHIPLYGMVRM